MRNSIQDALDTLYADEGMKQAALDAYRRKAAGCEARGIRGRAFRPILAALCALALLTGGLGVTAYALPVSYISIDVNPSVQLTLNRFDRVVGASALNEEGRALLEGLALNNAYYTEAVEQILNSPAAQPYLTAGEELTFTVASPREAALMDGIRSCECGRRGVCQSVSADVVGAAADCGLSLGKYRMYVLIQPLREDFTPQECAAMSMRRLRDLYDSLMNGESDQEPQNGGKGNGGGHGHGHGR